MAEGVIFHYRASDSFLSRMNPNAKLLSLLVFSAMVSSACPEAVLGLSALMLALAICIRLPFRAYLKEGVFFIAVAMLMALSSAAETGDAMIAMASGIGFLAVVLASMLLADTTMPDDISRSLGSALSRLIGKRAFTIAAALEMTISMIPIIVDCTASMFEARRSRSASFARHPLRSVTEFSIAAVSDLVSRAEAYTDALYARGYDAVARRGAPSCRAGDVAVIIGDLAVLALWMILPHAI